MKRSFRFFQNPRFTGHGLFLSDQINYIVFSCMVLHFQSDTLSCSGLVHMLVFVFHGFNGLGKIRGMSLDVYGAAGFQHSFIDLDDCHVEMTVIVSYCADGLFVCRRLFNRRHKDGRRTRFYVNGFLDDLRCCRPGGPFFLRFFLRVVLRGAFFSVFFSSALFSSSAFFFDAFFRAVFLVDAFPDLVFPREEHRDLLVHLWGSYHPRFNRISIGQKVFSQAVPAKL